MKLILLFLLSICSKAVYCQSKTILFEQLNIKIDSIRFGDSIQLKLTLFNSSDEDLFIQSTKGWSKEPIISYVITQEKRINLSIGATLGLNPNYLIGTVYLVKLKSKTTIETYTDWLENIKDNSGSIFHLDYVKVADVQQDYSEFQFGKFRLSASCYMKEKKML